MWGGVHRPAGLMLPVPTRFLRQRCGLTRSRACGITRSKDSATTKQDGLPGTGKSATTKKQPRVTGSICTTPPQPTRSWIFRVSVKSPISRTVGLSNLFSTTGARSTTRVGVLQICPEKLLWFWGFTKKGWPGSVSVACPPRVAGYAKQAAGPDLKGRYLKKSHKSTDVFQRLTHQ